MKVLVTGKFRWKRHFPRTTILTPTTGGSGFIGAHIVNSLLENGHSVVTTVRSEDKASKLRETHPGTPVSKLDFRIVEDIALEGAFDKAVKSINGLDAVIHSSSPFHFNVTDTKKDLLVSIAFHHFNGLRFGSE